jgi:intracellular multiplication protein IcmP
LTVVRSPRAGGAIGSDDYTGFSLILICVGLGILGWASWKLWHAQISTVALVVAHWEMQAIAFFSDRFSQADVGVQRANPAVVQFNDLVRLYRNIGTEFLYPAMALVLAVGTLCFRRAGNSRFTRAFDLDRLMAEQARTSRSTAAFVRRGLKLSGIRAGDPRPADPALHASEWIARYATRDGRFDEASARRELIHQLGTEWRSRADAPPALRCMLAVFALHGVQRREEAARLLGLLSEGLPVAGGDGGDGPAAPLAFDPKTLAIVDRALAELSVAAWALEIMDAHHFTTPGLMSVLNAARLRSGVLAPAQFAFLKLVDRRLWYALHALGFEADGPLAHPHPSQRVEAIGARAHWAAELAIGAPLPTPEFDAAIAAIRIRWSA